MPRAYSGYVPAGSGAPRGEFGALKRGGERKVADRLVSKLKKAMGY